MILAVTCNPAIDKRYIVDEVALGNVIRVNKTLNTIGGKGINVAKVAKTLGSEVVAIGFLGGYNGQKIRAGLKTLKIENEFVEVDSETRNCVNIYDKTSGLTTEFLEKGGEVTKEEEDKLVEIFRRRVTNCNVVTISGTQLQNANPNFYFDLINIAKGQGKKVILDSSLLSLTNGIKAKPFMIKPNSDEVFQLTGTNIYNFDDAVVAALKLYESGIKIVTLTLGKHGSLTVCDEGIYTIRAPKVKKINSIGSGDSFVAAMAYCFEQDYSIKQSLIIATAVSTASVLTEEAATFNLVDYERLLPEVIIGKM